MILKKRLRHFIDTKIPEYYHKLYPSLVNFIYGFVDFVDQECAMDIMNITNNLDPDKINTRFLDSYFNQYCKDLIDQNRYQLTDENKRLFMSIAKLLYNNKGKKLSFDISLKYLTQFFVFNDENYVDKIEYELVEDVKFWEREWVHHYTGETYRPHQKPYTYLIKGDFTRELTSTMVENLNPVGFYPEFQFPVENVESYNIATAIEQFSLIEGQYPTENIYVADAIETNQIDHLQTPNISEMMDISENIFRYDGKNTYNGSRFYDGKDVGVFELYSILTYVSGSLTDSFEKLTE